MPRIQTEILVADILTMYQTRTDSFIFICYAIANKLNQNFRFYTGADDYFCAPYHWLNSDAGTGTLSRQIDRQMKNFVNKLNPELQFWNKFGEFFNEYGFVNKLNPELQFWNTFGEFFNEYGGETVAIYKSGMPINPMLIELATGNHAFRRQFLEFIVEMDPNAVFTVDIYTGLNQE